MFYFFLANKGFVSSIFFFTTFIILSNQSSLVKLLQETCLCFETSIVATVIFLPFSSNTLNIIKKG